MRQAIRAAIRRATAWAAGHERAVAGLLAIVVFAVFLPSLGRGFVNWDDRVYVCDNPLVLRGLSWEGVRRACTEVVYHNWAPLTILSYQADATFFGTGPWGFHLTNVVLHAASSALLYLALVRMTAAPGRSAAVTLLFALHPLRVESVTWVAERKDVLSVLFLMLALVAYERTCRRPSVGGHLAVAAAMLGSLLSKATLVTLPVLLVLLDVWPLRRAASPRGGDPAACPPCSWRRLVGEKLPLLGLAAVFVAITIASQSHVTEAESQMPLLRARLPNALESIAVYLGETLLPLGLHPIHVHPGPDRWSPGLVAAGLACVAGLVTGGVLLRDRVPAVPVGAAWFLVALSPVLGIVKKQGFQAHADRFTYVPHIGLFLAVVWGAAALAERLRLPGWLPPAAVAAVLAWWIPLDWRQIAVWTDSNTLWSHTLAVDPANSIAHEMSGIDAYLARDYPTARGHFVAAMNSRRGRLYVTPRLAAVCFDMGDLEEARRLRQQALMNPGSQMTRWLVQHMRQGIAPAVDPEARRVFEEGVAALREERVESALEAFGRAVALAPDYAAAHDGAGLALARGGRDAEAIDAWRRAVAANPLNADYRVHLAQGLLRLGRKAEAVGELDAALLNDPTDAVALNLRLEAEAPAGEP